jgi:hypothetical protein
VHQRGEVVLIGKLELRVVLAGSGHRQLQRWAEVEARRSLVSVALRLPLSMWLESRWSFALEKGELAHDKSSP